MPLSAKKQVSISLQPALGSSTLEIRVHLAAATAPDRFLSIPNRVAGNAGVGVLDIGTGSGLLALLAKKEGGDRVTACECFLPVAKTAEKCIETNKADIKLVMK